MEMVVLSFCVFVCVCVCVRVCVRVHVHVHVSEQCCERCGGLSGKKKQRRNKTSRGIKDVCVELCFKCVTTDTNLP